MSQAEPWDDALMDGLALVEAWRRNDEGTSPAISSILRSNDMQMAGVALALAKLLSEITAEQGIDPVHFRRWAVDAARRP